jgi:hypothetical protein
MKPVIFIVMCAFLLDNDLAMLIIERAIGNEVGCNILEILIMNKKVVYLDWDKKLDRMSIEELIKFTFNPVLVGNMCDRLEDYSQIPNLDRKVAEDLEEISRKFFFMSQKIEDLFDKHNIEPLDECEEIVKSMEKRRK